MNILRDVARELLKMFLADLRLSIAIFLTVLAAGLAHLAAAPGWIVGLILILGTVAAIAAAILSAARRSVAPVSAPRS